MIIIGAGPTGLSLAAELMRHKVDFIIIDKKPGTTELSKAIVVQARTLEIFDDNGLAEKAMKNGRITTAFNLYYKGKRRAAVDLAGLGEGLSPFPFALSLEQSKTEKLLADHLNDHGKQVQWNTEVTSFQQSDDGVTVHCSYNGEQQIIKADFLAGCDGAGSWVRHELGLSFEGTTEPKLFYVADVVLSSPVINKDELYMFMISKGFVLFFPMEGKDHYRIVGILPGETDESREYNFADVEPVIKQSIVTKINFDELRWFSTYKVHSRMAGEFRKGRCFIAGDAAHIHTPAGGQGMNTGIQDAYNLGWKIAYYLRGEINEQCLETYNTERSANARNLLRSTDRIFDIMSGSNRFWNFLRLNFFPWLMGALTKNKLVQKQIFPLISQIGIKYPESYLSLKSSLGKVKAGDRMPYFVFSNGRHLFSYLHDPCFKLLFFGEEERNKSHEAAITELKMIMISFKEIPVHLFSHNSNFYVLLRPDNHVSYIGADVKRCKELTEKISAFENNKMNIKHTGITGAHDTR